MCARFTTRSILPQPLYPILHQGLKRIFPQCVWELDALQDIAPATVALTFDDGPHPKHTPALLGILDELEVKATFFVLGCRVERWPHLVESIINQGHHIGIHGYDHVSFPSLSIANLQQALAQTRQLIAAAICQEPEVFQDVRPPNGLFLPQTLDYLCAWHYRPVMWSVVPEDWMMPSVEEVVQRILIQVYPGALIVLHDGVHGGAQVAETVRILVPALIDRGYSFTTLASRA